MNQTLKDAHQGKSRPCPEAEQEELAQALLAMAARKRIDAKLAARKPGVARTSHADFMAELRSRLWQLGSFGWTVRKDDVRRILEYFETD